MRILRFELNGRRYRRRSTAAGRSRCAPGPDPHRRRRAARPPTSRRSSTTATAWPRPGRPTGRRRRGRRGRRGPLQRPSSSINVLGAHASPWQTTSRSIGIASVTHGGGPNGQSSTGRRSCSSRSPAPIARAAVRGVGHPVRVDRRPACAAPRCASQAVTRCPARAGTSDMSRAAQRSRSRLGGPSVMCPLRGGETLTYSRAAPIHSENVTPPSSLTQTATTGLPPAMPSTISGTGTGSLGTLTRD